MNSLKAWLIGKLRLMVESRGFWVSRQLNQSEVMNLISSLRPKKSTTELFRIGPNRDGGYLVPSGLDGVEACFSPGVAQVSDFELECSKMGMDVHLADASVSGAATKLPANCSFEKKFLGLVDEGKFITIDDWVSRRHAGKSDLLLQMDIEGAEYDVIRSMSLALQKRFRYMVIEFHDLHDLFHHRHQYSSLRKLLTTHDVVHLHPNDCCPVKFIGEIGIPPVLEITFARKEYAHQELIPSLPHKLDFDNTSGNSIKMPEMWFGGDK